IVSNWWESMPLQLPRERVELVVQFSAWVLEKQPQRKGFVKKLLCLDDKGKLCLRPNDETLLAEPYAGSFRRLFFPGISRVAPAYVTKNATANRTDWRAFFEKLDPPPIGRFFLLLNGKVMSYSQLAQFVGENYKPPACRVTWMRGEWRDFKVQS